MELQPFSTGSLKDLSKTSGRMYLREEGNVTQRGTLAGFSGLPVTLRAFPVSARVSSVQGGVVYITVYWKARTHPR